MIPPQRQGKLKLTAKDENTTEAVIYHKYQQASVGIIAGGNNKFGVQT
jgi:protein involved in ribonucleotide reduction